MSLARSTGLAMLALVAAGAAGAPADPLPDFVVRMADETIARLPTLGPIRDHATAVALFGWEFLNGFLQPGTLCPGCAGVGHEGMLAGQRFRREHPDRHDEVMRGYGYALTTVDGTCLTAFEASRFTPKHERKPTPDDQVEWNWWVGGWGDTFVGPPAPRLPGHGKAHEWACRMTGWLSPRGGYGHMNMYGHQFLVVRSEVTPAPDSAP